MGVYMGNIYAFDSDSCYNSSSGIILACYIIYYHIYSWYQTGVCDGCCLILNGIAILFMYEDIIQLYTLFSDYYYFNDLIF